MVQMLSWSRHFQSSCTVCQHSIGISRRIGRIDHHEVWHSGAGPGAFAGIILFLVALINVINQYGLDEPSPIVPDPPTMKMAMSPLAFPTIVTPYGIATVIVMMAISPDLQGKVMVLV
jgi:hypothetical protein